MLFKLDALVQLAVLDRNRTAPPGSPVQGDRHIVAGAATGDWSGHDGEIAAWLDGAWRFFAPNAGWLAWDISEAKLVVFHGGDWEMLAGLGS